MKIAIVASRFHPEIVDEMVSLAEKRIKEKATLGPVVRVPGAYDIPFGVRQVIEKVDGVVTLGALVKGETSHDTLIAHAAAEALQHLSLQYNKPVVLGITGPDQTKEQAVGRIGRTDEIVDACLALLQLSP
ncbi:MAG: 6,7-dimethyl-8-ribityllumazine synthase [Nanoarchaeota archaeon]|nr:6,7-dimethyl-8-ribityllumazine synthase [Nanoarchaeota archaeon]